MALIGGRDLRSLAVTLGIGALGGALFSLLQLPLAWMLGAMVATTVAALVGVRLYVPFVLRTIMFPVLGVMLGSTFTPELLGRIGQWPLTLLALAVYLPVTISILYLYFHRWLGYDRATAYFSSVPGGFSDMVVVGAEMGADVRIIALVQASRVLLVVLIVPLWFRVTEGGQSSIPGASVADAELAEMAVLLACAVGGFFAGKWLRVPAYRIVGPLLASAAVHVLGLSHSTPPVELVAIAQVVLGAYVGARFTGVSVALVLRTIGLSLGSTAIMLITMVLFVLLLEPFTEVAPAALVLAYAPGGFPEMSLVALALGVETAFVATHHFVRILLLVTSAPLLFRFVFGQPAPRDD